MHKPVLVNEVITALNLQPHQSYIDATFGGGGYARAILESEPTCKVKALDRDPEATERAKNFIQEFPERFEFFSGRFSDMEGIFGAYSHQPNALLCDDVMVDGVVFDLGVSSFQLDDPARGFSFRHNGALDMRMNPDEGISCQDVINRFSKDDLVNIIQYYGEQPGAHRIAQAICDHRRQTPITTTAQLAEIVCSVVPKTKKIHPATLVFQGLRIYVNNELEEIEKGLEAAVNLLHNHGKLVVVTFHSLEERVFKNFIKKFQKNNINNYRLRPSQDKLVFPSKVEVRSNPRSRCAKLRSIVKTPL